MVIRLVCDDYISTFVHLKLCLREITLFQFNIKICLVCWMKLLTYNETLEYMNKSTTNDNFLLRAEVSFQ